MASLPKTLSADLVQTLLGAALYAGVMALALVAVGRAARQSGLLVPVLVGGLLRLAVMAVAHLGSLELGDGGFFFLDDRGYAERGELLAVEWRAGGLVDPSAYNYAGTYQFGYPALVGGIFTLVGHSVAAAKLVNVLAGTTTVLLVGLLAGRVVGPGARRRATWGAALFPTLVWWSAPLMKEAVTTLLFVSVLLAATYVPRRSASVIAVGLTAALFLVRTGAVAGIIVGVGAALALAMRRVPSAESWAWLRRLALTGAAATTGILLLSRGDLGALALQYSSTIENMIDRYQGSDPAAVPLDALKTLVTPLPWVFDLGTRNWDIGLYPGVWALFMIYPLAGLGIWRLRHRPELAMLLLSLISILVMNAATSGFTFRQRSVIEPIVIVLATAGVASYRQATRWGALALGIVAPVAVIQSGSPATGLLIAGCAGIVWLLSSRVSTAEVAKRLPSSTLVESLRAQRPQPLWPSFRRWMAAAQAWAPQPAPVDKRGVRSRTGLASLGQLAPSLREPTRPSSRVNRAAGALRRAGPAPAAPQPGRSLSPDAVLTWLRHQAPMPPAEKLDSPDGARARRSGD